MPEGENYGESDELIRPKILNAEEIRKNLLENISDAKSNNE
jgi:hypothetical protein